jgi:hypothetical protein
VDSIAADSLERNGIDVEAQRVARDAIMEIRLFPDLTVALRGGLGYGPHVDMVQHFCYWMHPRHPKMQNRWTMYKTYAEWRDECSLSDRQVRKGRKVLRELGLVTEKKSNYGRIVYRVDWVVLAKALSLDTNTVQTDEDWDDFDLSDDDHSLDANTVQGQSGRYSEESSLDANTVQANAGEYAGDYLQETTLLQRAPEPAYAEPGAPEINRDKEQKKGANTSLPGGDKRHSQDAGTSSAVASPAAKVVNLPAEGLRPPKPSDASLLTDVRDILNPESGRWPDVKYIWRVSGYYTPEKVVSFLEANLEDVKRPRMVMDASGEQLLDAVRYVMWQRERREAS